MSISACMFSECRVWCVGQLVHSSFKLDNVLLFVLTVEVSCYVKIDKYSPWAAMYILLLTIRDSFLAKPSPAECVITVSYYYTGLKGFQIVKKFKTCVFVSFKTQIIYRINCKIKTITVVSLDISCICTRLETGVVAR